MLLDSIKELFLRDLEKVKQEISLYRNEINLWSKNGDIKNSGGNLCLHLIGNLKAYIGVGLAELDYTRDREFEFNGSDITKEQLLIGLDETMEAVSVGLTKISEADLEKDFPIVIWDEPTKMVYTILHLHSHLNYHLGQINYHRRMIDVN